jgi:hypothetical protein
VTDIFSAINKKKEMRGRTMAGVTSRKRVRPRESARLVFGERIGEGIRTDF